MRTFLVLLLSLAFSLLACTENKNKAEQQDLTAGEQNLEPAVPNTPEASKKMNTLQEVAAPAPDLKLKMTLPEGVSMQTQAGDNGYLLESADGTFRMIMVPGERTPDDLMDYWQSNPEPFKFRSFIVSRPEGVLVEVERDGKLDYQVDYTLQVDGESYLLRSDASRAYSRSQAELMYHTCRSILALNQSR